MALHHKIIHHLRRHKERVIAHIQKHHKKYTFWWWVVTGIGIVSIIVLIWLFLGINMMVGKSQAMDEEMKIYKQLAVFNVIDDFMHQRFKAISTEMNPGTAEMDKQFPIIDAAFHTAKNLNEKYKAAETMVAFVLKWRDIVRDLWYTTPDEDRAFDAMIYQFYQIR